MCVGRRILGLIPIRISQRVNRHHRFFLFRSGINKLQPVDVAGVVDVHHRCAVGGGGVSLSGVSVRAVHLSDPNAVQRIKLGGVGQRLLPLIRGGDLHGLQPGKPLCQGLYSLISVPIGIHQCLCVQIQLKLCVCPYTGQCLNAHVAVSRVLIARRIWIVVGLYIQIGQICQLILVPNVHVVFPGEVLGPENHPDAGRPRLPHGIELQHVDSGRLLAHLELGPVQKRFIRRQYVALRIIQTCQRLEGDQVPTCLVTKGPAGQNISRLDRRVFPSRKDRGKIHCFVVFISNVQRLTVDLTRRRLGGVKNHPDRIVFGVENVHNGRAVRLDGLLGDGPVRVALNEFRFRPGHCPDASA